MLAIPAHIIHRWAKTSRGERRNAAPPPTDTVRALWLEGGRVRSFEGLLQTTYSGAQGDCVVPYPPRPVPYNRERGSCHDRSPRLFCRLACGAAGSSTDSHGAVAIGAGSASAPCT